MLATRFGAPLILAVFAATAGCAQHATKIRTAQDAFSEGAELELARKLGLDDVAGASNPIEEPQRHYAIALGAVEEAIADDKGDLQRDSLYGVALTIKALCLWRLGDPKLAKATADEVVALHRQNSESNHVWPRDYGICKSMVTIVKIDALGSRAKQFEDTPDDSKEEETLRKILEDCESTSAELAGLGDDAELEGHSFQVYVAQAHCELAHVAWVATGAAVRFNDDTAPNASETYKQRYNALRAAALARLQEVPTKHRLPSLSGRVAKMGEHYASLLPELR